MKAIKISPSKRPYKSFRMVESWAWLDKICGKLDQDFVDIIKKKPAQQKRSILSNIFNPPKKSSRINNLKREDWE